MNASAVQVLRASLNFARLAFREKIRCTTGALTQDGRRNDLGLGIESRRDNEKQP